MNHCYTGGKIWKGEWDKRENVKEKVGSIKVIRIKQMQEGQSKGKKDVRGVNIGLSL
jgi:hypothetical protein